MCNDHRTNIKAKIESSCKFLEIKGMKVPISPDGIPMVNLARPINENQSTPNSPESTDQRYGKDLIMLNPHNDRAENAQLRNYFREVELIYILSQSFDKIK